MRTLLLLSLMACNPDSDVKDDTGPGDTSPVDTGPDDTGWDPRFDPLVEAILADLAASDAPGVSVAVMEDGEVTFARAFGSGHPDQDVPITADTLFQIGSDTKKQTAVALLRKVEQGLVSLDDSLAELLPQLEFANDAEWNDQILVEHLLTHQGGFYDYTPWDDAPDDAHLADFSYGEFADNEFLMNPPGSFWNYANPNFSLAGLVTEVHDERAWPEIMVEDVYAPLGMDRSYLRKSEVIEDGDYAVGYGVNPLTGRMETREMDSVADNAWTRPAGMAWSTATQQLYFARFLLEGDDDVLADELVEAMHAEQVSTLYLEDELHYGYGLMVQRGLELDDAYYEIPVWNHGGNTLAFTSIFQILPEQGFAISILSSAYATDFSGSVDTAIRSLVDGLPTPVDPPAYVIDTDRFALHVGEYVDEWNVGPATVGKSGDALTIDLPVLTRHGYTYDHELIALSSDIHYIRIDGYYYDLTFIQTEEGEPSHFIRNRSFVLSRDDGEAITGSRRVPTKADIDRFLAEARVLEPLPAALRVRR
jgi:CubicO group peptidase (beta-lactamase class C family)